MTVSLADILAWLPVLNVLVLPAIGVLVRALRRDLASREDLLAQAERLARLDQKVALIERDIQHLPDGSDFEDLRKWMSQMAASTATHSTQLGGLSASVARIEDYLLKDRREAR